MHFHSPKSTSQVYACDQTVRPKSSKDSVHAPNKLSQEVSYWMFDTSGLKTDSHLLPGNRRACTIVADLSALRGSMKLQTNYDTSKKYYELPFEIRVYFGQTALSAELCWREKVSCLV